MMTFENFVKHGYMAYKLSDSSRTALLHHFTPKYSTVIAHHVTYKFPAKSTDELPPDVTEAHVVGYAEEPGLEALVVEVNGSTKRPDGGTLHITLSLDKNERKKPAHSNKLLQGGFQHVNRIPIHLTPAFLQ
jgi:hypothetical protein